MIREPHNNTDYTQNKSTKKESLPEHYGKKEPSDKAVVRPTAVAPKLVKRFIRPSS
jgi:hypothetical protein